MISIKAEQKKVGIILVFILILGAVLLLYQLGQKSFWISEMDSLNKARANLKFILKTVHMSPFYHFLLHFWTKISLKESFVRLPSVVFALFSILLLFKLGKTLFNYKIGLLSSFFLAISPMFILYAREARMYSLLVLLSLFSISFFVKLLEKNKIIYWLGYLSSTLLGVFTHASIFFIIGFQNIFILFERRRYREIVKRWWLIQSLIIILPLFLRFLPSIYRFRDLIYFVRYRIPYSLPFSSWVNIPYTFFAFSLGETVMPWNLYIVIPAAFIFGSCFILGWYSIRANKEKLLSMGLYFVFPLLVIAFFNNFWPKYLLPILPAYYLIISIGILRLKNIKIKTFLVLSIALLSSYSLFNYYTNSHFHNMNYVEPYRELMQYIKKNSYKDDGLICSYNPCLSHYYQVEGLGLRRYYFLDFIDKEKEDKPLVSSSALQQIKKLHPRIWIIQDQYAQRYMIDKEIHIHPRMWIIQGQRAQRYMYQYLDKIIGWLSRNLKLIESKKFAQDMDIKLKRKFIDKNFLDFRIILSLYQSK